MFKVMMILIAVIICIGFGALVIFLISRKKDLPKWSKPLLLIPFSLLPAVVFALISLNIYYHADDTAKEALQGTSQVNVSKTDEGWFFDGPGTENALIFYPGAKVEAAAYAPLMSELAAEGIDCYLVEMPLRIALLGINKADSMTSSGSYEHWYIAGHSMGGVAAANYCAEYSGQFDGLILLASYSVKKIGDGVDVLSVYGTQDKVLDRGSYSRSMSNLPDDRRELVIEGGNHAQFGCYGQQSGDGEADISPEQQRKLTVDAIKELVGIKAA